MTMNSEVNFQGRILTFSYFLQLPTGTKMKIFLMDQFLIAILTSIFEFQPLRVTTKKELAPHQKVELTSIFLISLAFCI